MKPNQPTSTNKLLSQSELRELIAAGESLDVEFKRETKKPNSDNQLLEAVVCLANRETDCPGWLLVGVEDDGAVSGARNRPDGPPKASEIAAMLNSRTQPSARVEVACVQLDNHTVVAVRVPPSTTPVCTSDGLFVKRNVGGDGKPACMPYYFSEMQSRMASQGLFDYTEVPLPELTMADLNEQEIDRYRQLVRKHVGGADRSLTDLNDIDLCKAINAVDVNADTITIRRLGLLLFGHEEVIREYLPTHEVAFHSLTSNQVKVNTICQWPLIRIIDHLDTMIERTQIDDELLVGMQRIVLPAYAPSAVREAVANALIHRDYTQMGAVQIRWLNDRFQVTNPGAFPMGVGPTNYLVTSSKTRNRSLVEAFKRAGIVERVARGIPTLFGAQLRVGRPAPEYDFGATGWTELTFPYQPANKTLVELAHRESGQSRELSVEELLILSRGFLENHITLPLAARMIQSSESSTKIVLDRLVSRGLLTVQQNAQKHTIKWTLSAPKGRPKTDPSLQQARQHQALKLFQNHDRVTRKDIAESLEITDWEARKILIQLIREGMIIQHGQRRWTWYELATKK